jgi:hypothetical protein
MASPALAQPNHGEASRTRRRGLRNSRRAQARRCRSTDLPRGWSAGASGCPPSMTLRMVTAVASSTERNRVTKSALGRGRPGGFSPKGLRGVLEPALRAGLHQRLRHRPGRQHHRYFPVPRGLLTHAQAPPLDPRGRGQCLYPQLHQLRSPGHERFPGSTATGTPVRLGWDSVADRAGRA